MGDLLTRIVEASSAALVVDGRPLDVDVDGPDRVGQMTFTYRVMDTVVAVRRLRVDEGSRTVSLLSLERSRWWFDDVALHERIVAGLDTDCVVTVVVAGPRSALWTHHFDWAPILTNANASAIAAGVSAVSPTPTDAGGGGEVPWGGSDLPERVLQLGGGTWRDLLRAMGPGQLHDALDALHPGLGEVVFANTPAWHGQRTVSARVAVA